MARPLDVDDEGAVERRADHVGAGWYRVLRDEGPHLVLGRCLVLREADVLSARGRADAVDFDEPLSL